MDHRYKAGQRVRFSPGAANRTAAGTYEVTCLLPVGDDGQHQYRIRNAQDKHERVAKESQLQHA